MDNVLLIGSAIVDITIEIPQLPLSGEDIEATRENYSIGGCALNVACVLQSFKIDYTAFLPIGNGIYSTLIQRGIEDLGIHSSLKINDGDNGHCYTFIESTGERSFVTLSGVEGNFKKDWFTSIEKQKFSYTYISGYSLIGNSGNHIVDYLETIPETKLIVAFGPRIDIISRPLMDRIYKLSPIIHINKEELKQVTGHHDVSLGIKELYKKTNELVIVTLGALGATYITEQGINSIIGEKVPVINTSGAGDAHVGGVIVGLIHKQEIYNIIKNANKISAKVVSQKDTKY
ncbi:MAG: PfkB family carbohydrate kinase [Brevinema sp.]